MTLDAKKEILAYMVISLINGIIELVPRYPLMLIMIFEPTVLKLGSIFDLAGVLSNARIIDSLVEPND